MSAKNQFDWIAFYEEFADKLLAYKDNRQELIEKIKQVYEVTGIKLPTLERNENGDNEIVDIDPFTTFGLFNKGITNANRVKIITAIKDLFEVSSPVPTYFDGIPVLNNQMATFYWFGNGRGEHDIDNLWDVFDYAIAISKSDSAELREKFSNSFNVSLSQKGVKWNLSMGLYWIRPNRFLNLDSRNRWFIINNDSLPESVVASVRNLKSMPEAEEYLAICDECLSYIHSDNSPYNSLSALSFSAWSVSKQDDGYEKLTEDSLSNSGAKFLRWFKPLLQALKDLGGSATPKEARNKIIENEKLTEEETSAVVGKTQTPEFNNDVAWARQYLVRSGYIDNSTYGIWKLTESGWTVDMTDELASEIFKSVIKENQKGKENKGSALADEDVGEHQLVPTLKEGINAHGGDGGLHQRDDDPQENAPDAAAVDAGRLVQLTRDLVHEARTHQKRHRKREGGVGHDQRGIGVEQVQTGQRHVHGDDGRVDRDGQAEHEELVHGLPALPDEPRQGKGRQKRHEQRDDDGRNGDDAAVEEVQPHLPGLHRAGIVGPEPVLRQADGVCAVDLLVVFQREGEHPIDGEQIDQRPEDEADVDQHPGGLACVSHVSPPP